MIYVFLNLHEITGGLWREKTILIVRRISAQRAQRLEFLLIFKRVVKGKKLS